MPAWPIMAGGVERPNGVRMADRPLATVADGWPTGVRRFWAGRVFLVIYEQPPGSLSSAGTINA